MAARGSSFRELPSLDDPLLLASSAYYSRYDGHDEAHLAAVHKSLREQHSSVIFLAGDSSMDNKHWVSHKVTAINGYEHILVPPMMKTDVCYWLNNEAVQRGATHLCCLNTAVESTSLNSRACGRLLEQDRFIRDNLTSEDYLVVSVGGNDIALQPLLCTIVNMLALAWCVPVVCMDRYACACPVSLPIDCGCYGCGLPGCLSGFLCGFPPPMGYFVDLFKNRMRNYILRLVARTKPRKVVVCMVYFSHIACTSGGWADCPLGCMCYTCMPWRLHTAIRTMFRLAIQQIRIPGTEVVALPLYETLDGKTSSDYVERVEPSATGGRKIAQAVMRVIMEEPRGQQANGSVGVADNSVDDAAPHPPEALNGGMAGGEPTEHSMVAPTPMVMAEHG